MRRADDRRHYDRKQGQSSSTRGNRVKVFVESSVCRGHGMCEYLAPEVFRIGPHGFVEILMDPTEGLRPQVTQAAQSCPEGAIALIE